MDESKCQTCGGTIGGYSVYVKVDTGYLPTCSGHCADELHKKLNAKRRRDEDRKK